MIYVMYIRMRVLLVKEFLENCPTFNIKYLIQKLLRKENTQYEHIIVHKGHCHFSISFFSTCHST